jgi:hydroxymethylpyrimidine pyrophosphatase-like HAD family hydrolase
MDMFSEARPLVFVDLDDTLFQTARKMQGEKQRFLATRDSAGQPNGYMSLVQMMFTRWLFESADVVPVTARGVESFLRVEMPFKHGAICSHGGVILDAQGKPLKDWDEQVKRDLTAVQAPLAEAESFAYAAAYKLSLNLRITMIEVNGLSQFLVIKHSGETDEVLAVVEADLKEHVDTSHFYFHRNGNNLAIIPLALNKQAAVREYLKFDRSIHGQRPVLGFGDSLSDHGFLSECHWWGTPGTGQLARFVEENIA